MEPATEAALATIIGALHHTGRLTDKDVAKIVEMLDYRAQNDAPYVGQPLASLARAIEDAVS